MSIMFNTDRRLHIPDWIKAGLTFFKPVILGNNYFVRKGYCPKGHSLMSNIKINELNGIHLLVTDLSGERKCNLILSPFARTGDYVILSGTPFSKNEIVKVFCPKCETELDVLFNCKCGAPIYIIYADKHLDRNHGWSFCSREGCSKHDTLKPSKKTLLGFHDNHKLTV